jgi:hypothetical protein
MGVIIDQQGGIKITKSSSSSKKGAKRSKKGKASRVKYRGTGRMFLNHASKLERLARRLERRISTGATPPKKVDGLKAHIKGLRKTASRWKDKRFVK